MTELMALSSSRHGNKTNLEENYESVYSGLRRYNPDQSWPSCLCHNVPTVFLQESKDAMDRETEGLAVRHVLQLAKPYYQDAEGI